MKIASLVPLILGALGCASSGSGVVIEVGNPAVLERPCETVSIPWERIVAVCPDLAPERAAVVDTSSGALLLAQPLDADGDGAVDELLFQAALGPHATRRFEVVDGGAPSWPRPLVRAFGRFVPERADDFAWENDRVAFRMYGPALAADAVGGGVDCWLKRVSYPVIDRWYADDRAGKSYHVDHGEGYDPYHVGASLGCGGLAVYEDGRLYRSNVFERWRLLADGPIRVLFELSYGEREVNGKRVSEVKRVSLDLGDRLTRFDCSLAVDGEVRPLTLALGITTHDGVARPAGSAAAGWIRCWEELDDSELGTGAVYRPVPGASQVLQSSADRDASHQLAVLTTDDTGRITYYAGYGWKKAGEITTEREWDAYLEQFALRLKHPLSIRVGGPSDHRPERPQEP